MKAAEHASSAQSLREAFDQSFVEAPETAGQGGEALLGLRLNNDPYALRVRDMAGLVRDRKVAHMPGAGGGFRGLAGIKGALVPVWDLSLVLGYPKAGQAQWLVLAASTAAWALSFDHFDGYLLLPSGALRPAAAEGPHTKVSLLNAVTPSGLVPVLDLELILKIIQANNPSALKGNHP
jgi:chemotaxis signal transduction protein